MQLEFGSCYPNSVATGDGAVWAASEESEAGQGDDVDYYYVLAKIDPRTGRILQVQKMPFTRPAVTVGLGGVWYAFGNTVEKIDSITLDRILSVQLKPDRWWGGWAYAGSIALGHDAVWVTQGKLFRLDPAKGEVVATIPLRDRAEHITIAGGAVWVVTGTGVSRVDSQKNVEVAWIPLELGDHPRIVFGASNVWVFDSRGQLARIDPRTNQIATAPRVESVAHVIPVGDDAVWILEKRRSTPKYRLVEFDPATNRIGQERPLEDWKQYETLRPEIAEHALWLCVEGWLRRIPSPN